MKWKIDQLDALPFVGPASRRSANLEVSRSGKLGSRMCRSCDACSRQALRDEHGLPSELAEMTRRAGVLEWEWKD